MVCPSCGSRNVHEDYFETFEDGTEYREHWCGECDAEWQAFREKDGTLWVQGDYDEEE